MYLCEHLCVLLTCAAKYAKQSCEPGYGFCPRGCGVICSAFNKTTTTSATTTTTVAPLGRSACHWHPSPGRLQDMCGCAEEPIQQCLEEGRRCWYRLCVHRGVMMLSFRCLTIAVGGYLLRLEDVEGRYQCRQRQLPCLLVTSCLI